MITPPARLGLVVWLLGFWCAGCSGTPLGEQLAERLSEPDAPVAADANLAATLAEEPLPESQTPSGPDDPEEDDPEAGVSASPPNPAATAPPADPTTTATADSPAPAPNTDQGASPSPDTPITTPSPRPLNPASYRLRLRLPAADPAAPAEAVTRALRAAGILFEVEAIERLPTAAPPKPAEPSP